MPLKLVKPKNAEYLASLDYLSVDSLQSFRRYLSVMERQGKKGALFSPDPLRHLDELPNLRKYWFRDNSAGHEKRGAIPKRRLGEYVLRQIKPGEVIAIENIGYAMNILTTENVISLIKEADAVAAKKGARLAIHVSPNTVDNEELESILGLIDKA